MKISPTVLLCISLAAAASAQKSVPKTAPKNAAIPCKTTIEDDSATVSDLGSLSAEKLASLKSDLTDCVLTERRLSKDDLLSAYRVRDALDGEIWKRVMDLAKTQDAKYDDLRSHGKEVAELLVKINTEHQGLIQQYNGLVEKFNSLLGSYRTNIDDNIRFSDRMREALSAQAAECNGAIRDAIQSVPVRAVPAYKPMQQTHCTAHTISNPISGNWTYMDCN